MFIKLIIILSLFLESFGFILPVSFKLINNNKNHQSFLPLKTNKMSLLNRTDIVNDWIEKSLLFVFVYLTSTSIKSNNYEQKNIDIFKRNARSVCFISTEYSQMASKFNLDTDNIPKGVGTGFIWDYKGHIVTNFHVINKIDNATVIINNKTYSATVTGIEPERDIAVLKINNSKYDNLFPITIGSIEDVNVGQFAYAIGNPFGQDKTFTTGIISALNREIYSPTGRKITGIIQTDAAINPGNSGGPLLNSEGQIIGMNTATFGAGTSSGVSFAIPINTISKVVNEIIKNGGVEKAIIGISYLQRLPSAYESKIAGIPEIKKGIIILNVPENSTTGLIGIKKINEKKVKLGDIIIGIDNYEVNDPQELATILDNYKPNDKIKLKIIRDGKVMIKEITLTTYKTKNYTNLEVEVPLGNIAPQITPKIKN